MITTVVWDFNGTVLDDMAASVGAVNRMLARRGLPPITEEWYTAHLVMPLEAFYASIGFDMARERIGDVSLEFQEHCARFPRPVFPEVRAALERLRARGLHQWLFSSLNHTLLMEQAAERDLPPCFDLICGRGDHTLGNKTDALAQALRAHGVPACEALIVGDLTTDWEMAHALGAHCALIPKGHQNEATLRATGARVIRNASELEELL